MRLGNRIQELRKQRNLSQEQLAEKLMVSRQAVSKWELDESTPDADKIVKLSALFQVSTDYLLREDMDDNLQNNIYKGTDSSIASNAYEKFLGRWVKIFFDDRAFAGLYQVAVLDIHNNYILFKDRKGKNGFLTIKNIISISGADIYKRNPNKVPEIVLEDKDDSNFLEYFQGRQCQIHFVCKSVFTGPQGCIGLVERITDNEVFISNRGKNSIIRLDRILTLTEQ